MPLEVCFLVVLCTSVVWVCWWLSPSYPSIWRSSVHYSVFTLLQLLWASSGQIQCISCSNNPRWDISGWIFKLSFKFYKSNRLSSYSNPGQHRRWDRRSAHATSRPCTLLPGLPADGSRLRWLLVWHGLSRCLPSTSPSVFLWDSWRCAPAPGVGDGQDRIWPEILSQVSMKATSVCSVSGVGASESLPGELVM